MTWSYGQWHHDFKYSDYFSMCSDPSTSNADVTRRQLWLNGSAVQCDFIDAVYVVQYSMAVFYQCTLGRSWTWFKLNWGVLNE